MIISALHSICFKWLQIELHKSLVQPQSLDLRGLGSSSTLCCEWPSSEPRNLRLWLFSRTLLQKDHPSWALKPLKAILRLSLVFPPTCGLLLPSLFLVADLRYVWSCVIVYEELSILVPKEGSTDQAPSPFVTQKESIMRDRVILIHYICPNIAPEVKRVGYHIILVRLLW